MTKIISILIFISILSCKPCKQGESGWLAIRNNTDSTVRVYGFLPNKLEFVEVKPHTYREASYMDAGTYDLTAFSHDSIYKSDTGYILHECEKQEWVIP